MKSSWAISLLLAAIICLPVPADAATGETHWIPAEDFKPCGPMSLYVLGRLLGHSWRLDNVLAKCPPADNGAVSAEQIKEAGQQLGQKLTIVRIDTGQISDAVPCIIHLRAAGDKEPHFCVVAEVRADRWLLIDPPQPIAWVAAAEVAQRWDGVAIVADSPTVAHRLALWLGGSLAFLAGIVLFLIAKWRLRLSAGAHLDKTEAEKMPG